MVLVVSVLALIKKKKLPVLALRVGIWGTRPEGYFAIVRLLLGYIANITTMNTPDSIAKYREVVNISGL